MAASDAWPTARIWNEVGLSGLPDIAVEGDQNKLTIHMPPSADGLSLGDLSNGLQEYAAYTAYAATVLSAEEAKVEYIEDKFEHAVALASAKMRQDQPDAVKKLTVDGIRALVIEGDPELIGMAEELRIVNALVKRHTRLYEGYKTSYNAYSRQVEFLRIEHEQTRQTERHGR